MYYSEERKNLRRWKFFSFIIAVALALAIIFIFATIIAHIAQIFLWQSNRNPAVSYNQKESAIGEIKMIFAEVYDPATNSVKEPDYIRPGATPEEIFQAVDIYFSRFVRLNKALDFLAPPESELTNLPDNVWQEIGIPKRNGQFLFWYSGLNAARALYEYAKIQRRPAGVEGEKFVWPFLDRAQIAGAVIWIFREIESSPKEIGASDESLRAIALTSLRSQILAIGEQVTAGQISAGICKNKIAALVKRGIDDWHFSERELGADKSGKIFFRPQKGGRSVV